MYVVITYCMKPGFVYTETFIILGPVKSALIIDRGVLITVHWSVYGWDSTSTESNCM